MLRQRRLTFNRPSKISSLFKNIVKIINNTYVFTDDQFLMTFLRGCKYSIERVKEKLDMFYTLRSAIPELMVDRDPFNQTTAAIIRLG